MQEEVFTAFRDLIYRESGINLKPEKRQLLSARIQKRLRDLGIQDPSSYLHLVESDRSGSELTNLLDAISTNVTYFFREPAHFDFLAEVFKEWRTQGRKRIRMWCAASSSGQEPYTIAMCAREYLDLKRTDFKLLATDLCTRVLQQAMAGEYPEAEIEKVPPQLLKKYFSKERGGGDNTVRVNRELADIVSFRKMNLVHIPYPVKGPVEIIFCRNVMIYFDVAVRQKIVSEFARVIPKGGYLILSHSESLMGLDVPFDRKENSIYVRQ